MNSGSNPTTGILETGVANTASVRAALERLGAHVVVVRGDPAPIRDLPALVLPGVGSFAAGMSALRDGGCGCALRRRIEQGGPTLAICLGFHLLCRSSEESPGISGLGVLPFDVCAFDRSLVVPQIGWNDVNCTAPGRFLTSGQAYFAHSFRIVPAAGAAPGFMTTSDYGGTFVSAVERGNLLACQFHPELSGAYGEALLRRWLAAAKAVEQEGDRC